MMLQNNLINITNRDFIYSLVAQRIGGHLPKDLRSIYDTCEHIQIIATDCYFLHYSLYPFLRNRNDDAVLEEVRRFIQDYMSDERYQRIKMLTTLDDEMSLVYSIALAKAIIGKVLGKLIGELELAQIMNPDKSVKAKIVNAVFALADSGELGLILDYATEEAEEVTKNANEIRELIGGKKAGKEAGTFKKVLDLAEHMLYVKFMKEIVTMSKKLSEYVPKASKILKKKGRYGDELSGYTLTKRIEKALPREIALPDELFFKKLTSEGFLMREKLSVAEGAYYLLIDKCLDGNTLIPLRSGEIVPIKDIKVGDEVLSVRFDRVRRRFYNVVKGEYVEVERLEPKLSYAKVLFVKEDYKEVLEIKTPFNSIKMTKNHVIPVYRNGKIVEIFAGDIRVGDYLLMPVRLWRRGLYSKIPEKKEVTLPPIEYRNGKRIKVKLNSKFAQLLGYILGDGHVSVSNKSHSAYVCITDDNRELLECYKQIANDVLGDEKAHIRNYSNRLRLVINCRPFALWLKENMPELVYRSRDREIPRIITRAGRDVLPKFLRGLFDAEGSVAHHNVLLATTSEKLAKQVQMLLLRLGIVSHIYSGHNPANRLLKYDNRIVKDSKFYWISITGKTYLKRFMEKIGFTDENKMQKLREYIGDGAKSYWLPKKVKFYTKSFMLVPVTEIRELGMTKVYDIVLEKDHHFIADGYVVHNSGSMHGEKTIWARSVAMALYRMSMTKKRRYFLRFFDTRVYPPDTPLNDPEDIVDAILKVKSNGGTDITNAISTALRDLMERGLSEYTNTIVIITDGEDVVQDLSRELKKANASLISVMIQGDNETLKALSDQYMKAELSEIGGAKLLKIVEVS